jgi:hypothetical protein
MVSGSLSYLWPVKLWRIIWAIYVLALSGMPCEAFCLDESTSATDQAALPASGDHSHEKGCSPFCLCATCPGFTVPQPPQLMTVAMPGVAIIVATLPRYQTPQGFDVPGRIWQPPRLS